MKKIYYSIILTVISLGSFGQKWTYNTGKSDFDGTYKTASIYGSGGEFPYTKPLFVINYFINGGINLYLTGAGYAGCGNKEAYLKFDKDEKTYKFNVTTNSNKDTWFISYYKGNELDFSTIDLLSKLKNHSRLSVRLLSDCGQIDYLFSLNGSTPAINFVSKEYVEWVNKEIETKKTRETEKYLNEKMEEKNKYFEMIEEYKSISSIEAETYFSISYIYFKPNSASYWNKIETKEKVKISNYSDTSEYYILRNTTSIKLPTDSIFFILKYDCNVKAINN